MKYNYLLSHNQTTEKRHLINWINLRIIECVKLEGSHKNPWLQHPESLKLNHMSKKEQHWGTPWTPAGLCCEHFPGEPDPVTGRSPSEEPFPNVQSELPVTQLPSVPLCPADGQQAEISIPLSAACLGWGADCHKATPQPSAGRARQGASATPPRPCPQGLLCTPWLFDVLHVLRCPEQ